MSRDAKPALCPSYRCEEGARLLGIVQHDGSVAFTPDDIRIDATFVETARRGRAPEARFRFAGPCQRGRCAQWTGERCGVIDGVLRLAAATGMAVSDALPDCAIRAQCRWFGQAGAEACRVCTLVITELPDGCADAGH